MFGGRWRFCRVRKEIDININFDSKLSIEDLKKIPSMDAKAAQSVYNFFRTAKEKEN